MPTIVKKSPNQIDVALDILRCKLEKHMSFKDIAKKYDVTPQAIHQKYHKLLAFFDADRVKEYEDNKAYLLSGVERVIIDNMLDSDKLKKASFNNLAYGLIGVNNINRLHRGQSTINTSNLSVICNTNDQLFRDFIRSMQPQQSLNPDTDIPDPPKSLLP